MLIGPYDPVARLVTSELNIAYVIVHCRHGNTLSGPMTSNFSMAEGGNVLYLASRCDTVHKAAADVAQAYNWNRAAVLYDSVQGIIVAVVIVVAIVTTIVCCFFWAAVLAVLLYCCC